ncbi:hypothetical protein FACS1894158_01240 [Betaproteobacteria bacterium]|nr:hypothetical protein FACS1894158_01240 [Betaproteobacteria bacterium]
MSASRIKAVYFFIMIFTLIKWLYVGVNAYLIVRLYRIKVIPQLTN